MSALSNIRVRERVERVLARVLFSLPHGAQLKLAGGAPIVVDGLTLHPELQLLIAVRERRGARSISSTPPPQARRHFRRETLLHEGPRIELGRIHDRFIQGPAGPMAIRHYAPPGGGEGRPALVYLHGGGFVIGDIDTADIICRMLCKHADVHVVSADYRLAPETPFPAGVEDALAAFEWTRANARELGADGDRVAVGGDSAGAQLAAIVSQELALAGASPAAQLLLYPATCRRKEWPSVSLFAKGFLLERADIEAFQRYYTGHLTGDAADDMRHRPLDGLTRLHAEAGKSLAPAVVVTAGFDPLRDEGDAYARALEAKGAHVVWRRFDDLVHGFANLACVSGVCRRAVVDVAADFRTILERRPA